MKSDSKPVVRNKRTGDAYFYNGENNFTNIRTGVSGTVSDEAAQKTFSINLEATALFNDFPNLTTLVNKLGLALEKNNY